MLPYRRYRSFTIASIFYLAILLVTGCARLPVVGILPEGAAVTRLTRVEPASPFAWNDNGTKIALVADTFAIYDPADGKSQPFGAAPYAIGWSSDGEHLAAVFPHGKDATLRIFNMRGAVLSEADISGHVTKLAWRSDDELLVAAVTVEQLSFGANVKGLLYRWKGIGKPAATTLSETTVRPFIAGWPAERLYQTFTFALSPLADEIAYTRLQDPPAFSPYVKIFIRNLESSAEKEVASAAITSAGAVYSADGERILYGDGANASHWLDPWMEKELSTIPTPGRTIALSPGNRYALIDGRLYRDGKEVVAFPATSEGAFAPIGGRLLVRYDDNLYMISGLGEPKADKTVPAERERLLTLRKWRSEGLISIPDYQAARERMLRQ